MPNLIIDLEVNRVDLVDEGANSEAFIKLYKRKETNVKMDMEQILAKMKPEHAAVIQEEIAKAKAEVPTDVAEELAKAQKALTEEIAKSKPEPKEPDFEEVLKGLDPEVQKVFKSLQSQKEAAEQVARDAAEAAANDAAIAKAKDLKALPVEQDKLVEVLKGVSDEVYDILKSANQAIQDGSIFEEVGKSKADTEGKSTSSSDAWDKIEKAAEKIAEEEKVTKAKAITLAVKNNPDLYREYLKGGAN